MLFPLRLALQEIAHWRVPAICQALLMAGAIAPVMLLFALQTGVIKDLRAHFESTPDNLRLYPASSTTRDAAWFETWRQDPQVRFLAPHPYENAAELVFESEANPAGVDTVMLASGRGDLMLPPDTSPPKPNETVLTASLAEQLGVGPGDMVRLVGYRPEPDEAFSRWEMTVTAVTPRSRWASDGALVHEDVLTQAWFWRQGYASPLFGLDGDPQVDLSGFPRFRLYARKLADMQPLAARLAAEGVDVRGDFGNAELADAVEGSTRSVAAVVSLAVMLGAAAALVASFLADAERLRPSLRLLRLDGLSRIQARMVLVWRALLIGAAGWALACVVFVFALAAANAGIASAGLPFAASGEMPLLAWAGFALAALLGAMLAALVVAGPALRRSRLEGIEHA